MLARISFDAGQKVSNDELKEISSFLADEIAHSELVVDQEGNIKTFYSWEHTFNPEEADDKKKLVRKADVVELGTSKEYLADVNMFIQKFPKISVRVRGMIQTSNQHINNLVDNMLQIEKKLTDALQSFNEQIEFNQRVDVHVPNLGLMNINELAYANDKCTEELQDLLRAGWRIIAVCPQPDQRRPDYILGRFNASTDDVQCYHY